MEPATTIGAEHTMSGSNLAKNISSEIAKYETINLTPTERCLSGTVGFQTYQIGAG